MPVSSIGWRTDLALRRREGAEIIERKGHLLVRTAANPTYRWGNFLLYDAPPRNGDAERWIAQFQRDFPEAQYLAIGFDSPSGELGELADFAAAGMAVTVDAVLTASRLQPRPPPSPRAVFRSLDGEEDWRRALELRLATTEHVEPGYRDFLERHMRTLRAVCDEGHGAWFGAFRDEQLLSSLGIFDAGSRVARYQSVDTHPAHRRQGLASNLLLIAGRHAVERYAANTLVIAADPDYHAIDLYRSLGFNDLERHVQLERVARSS